MAQENYQKYKVRTPDIDDSCKNGKCEHKHEHIISNEPEKPQIEAITTTTTASPPPEPPQIGDEIRTDHKELSELMPLGINYAKCKDGNCGHEIISNSKITKNFKACPNCNDNGVPKKAKFCPTCKQHEPTDPDEKDDFWEDSEIDSEKIGDTEEDEE